MQGNQSGEQANLNSTNASILNQNSLPYVAVPQAQFQISIESVGGTKLNFSSLFQYNTQASASHVEKEIAKKHGDRSPGGPDNDMMGF